MQEGTGKPLKCGWLTKKGHFIKNWKRRYIILTSDRLWYYTDNTLSDLKGEFRISGGGVDKADVSVASFPDTCGRPYRFALENRASNHRLELCAVDGGEKKEWLVVLRRMLGEEEKILSLSEQYLASFNDGEEQKEQTSPRQEDEIGQMKQFGEAMNFFLAPDSDEENDEIKRQRKSQKLREKDSDDEYSEEEENNEESSISNINKKEERPGYENSTALESSNVQFSTNENQKEQPISNKNESVSNIQSLEKGEQNQDADINNSAEKNKKEILMTNKKLSYDKSVLLEDVSGSDSDHEEVTTIKVANKTLDEAMEKVNVGESDVDGDSDSSDDWDDVYDENVKNDISPVRKSCNDTTLPPPPPPPITHIKNVDDKPVDVLHHQDVLPDLTELLQDTV